MVSLRFFIAEQKKGKLGRKVQRGAGPSREEDEDYLFITTFTNITGINLGHGLRKLLFYEIEL